MNPQFDITGLILAGGKSRRMGRPKADLDLGGDSLIKRVIDSVKPLCQEIIIVTNKPTDFLELNFKTVRDLVPGQGPLGGLATGLFYSRSRWTLAVACDLPFLNENVLIKLVETAMAAKRGPRAIVPRTEAGWQPLVAAYSRECIGPARDLLSRGGKKLDDLRNNGVIWVDLPEAEIRGADPELVGFTNINTPDELEQARTKIKDETTQ